MMKRSRPQFAMLVLLFSVLSGYLCAGVFVTSSHAFVLEDLSDGPQETA